MKSSRKVILVVFVVIFGGVILTVLRDMAEVAGKRDAQKQVLSRARFAGAPEGFLETKWLMMMNEVRQVRPNVQPGLQATVLVEYVEWFDRTVQVAYSFEDGFLLMVFFTFPALSSLEEYDEVRAEIEVQYGPMPEPKQQEDGRWKSTKEAGGIAISHDRYEQGGLMLQQLLIYKTPGR